MDEKLIFGKVVDKSALFEGITIPKAYISFFTRDLMEMK